MSLLPSPSHSGVVTRILRDDRAVVRLFTALAAVVLGCLLGVPHSVLLAMPSDPGPVPGWVWAAAFMLHGVARVWRTAICTKNQQATRALWFMDAPLGMSLWLLAMVVEGSRAVPASDPLVPLCVAGSFLFLLLHVWLICGEASPARQGETSTCINKL